MYCNSIADRLLACYINNPMLTLESDYPIQHQEFQIKFHEIIYVVCYNLAINGCTKVNLIDINEWLRPYEAQYNIYLDNSGDEYIKTILEITETDNFDYYYNEFRKISCLNRLSEKGFDIKEFFDEDKDDNTQYENLTNVSMQDIINKYNLAIAELESDYINNSDIKTDLAGCDEFGEFLASLEENPMYGSSYLSEYLNTINRGISNGQLDCYSSSQATGKTTISCATVANLCATKLWNEEKGDFEINPCKTRNGALYIQFEMDNIREIMPKFLSYITNIPTNYILNGSFKDDEDKKNRLIEGRRILKESNIHVINMQNFTKRRIENEIKKHMLKYGIDFVAFDYIQTNPALNAECVSENGGIGMRTDEVLCSITSFLKDMTQKYDIPIYTCSQTNGNISITDTLGKECIYGSQSVAFKLDVGGIFLKLRPKEEALVDDLIEAINSKGVEIPRPTHIFHLYKGRFSSFPNDVKVWVNVNLGTGRMQDCFITSWDNKLLNIEKTKLIRKD